MKLTIDINGVYIESSLEENFLGVIIDDQLTLKVVDANPTYWRKPVKSLMHLQKIASYMD